MKHKQEEENIDRDVVDTVTAVIVTAVTDLGEVEGEAAHLPHPALLAHHHHHQHVPHLPVGVADKVCLVSSPCNEKQFLPLLPLVDAGVVAGLLHVPLAGPEDHPLAGAPHVQGVGDQAGGRG